MADAWPRDKKVPTIAIVSSDHAWRRRVEEWCRRLPLTISQDGRDHGAITLYDLDGVPAEDWPSEAQGAVIFLSSFEHHQAMDVMGRIRGVSHLIAKGTPLEESVMMETLRRLVSRGGGRFENFFAGCHVTRYTIDDYAKKQTYVEAVRNAALAAGASEEGAGHAATVAWELVMNGLFNAPRDAVDLRPKYRHVARHVPLKVEDAEAIELTFVSGPLGFGITVRDRFGSLRREDIITNMQRALRHGREQILTADTAAGAGVGLYMLHRLCAYLEFDVHPGRFTEVRAILALSRRYRAMQELAHSFNLFFDAQEEA